MAHRFVEVDQPLPAVINHIETPELPIAGLLFATGNQRKLDEFSRILGEPVEGKKLSIDEVQVEDPHNWQKVAEEKAIAAWEANNRQPIIVEDTSIEVLAWDGRPGVFADQFTGDINARLVICDLATKKNDRRAIARVTLALFDGKEVHLRVGETAGTVPEFPRGSEGFGWDDIFEPDGQEVLVNWTGTRRTFAEMTGEEKDILSMRTKALQALKNNPFNVKKYIFMIPDPYDFQREAVDPSLLSNLQVRQHAYNLRAIRGTEPREDFRVGERQPYHELVIGPGIKRIVTSPDTPDLGFIYTPIDTAVDLRGKPKRLAVDNKGEPIFFEMGDESVKMALAARAREFILHHNDEMYDFLRRMIRGDIKTPERTNARSVVIEKLLGMEVEGEGPFKSVSDWYQRVRVTKTAALSELGFARNYTEEEMSRAFAANRGLIINTSGVPHSIFGLGGMPPVTGWRDVLSTAALSYMDCYIPRNSIYADHPELQLKLFKETKEVVQSLGLPSDIEELVISHIGVSLGCDDLEALEKTVREMHNEGCRLFRIYTTNPDLRVVEAAKRIRKIIGQDGGRICVGPIPDLWMAEKLIDPEINTNIIMTGHGAGENCTSLDGGGAANGLELAYGMSLISSFNKVAIGFEGGVGKDIGAILPFIDVISMNRKGVEGGLEVGGLYAQHADGQFCQPYPGSASPVTQWIEAMVSSRLRQRRVDQAGRLINNEGAPNYMFKHRSQNSVVDSFHFFRMLAGRSLADRGVRTIDELRMQIAKTGDLGKGHRIITLPAKVIAGKHRGS